ncbi:uncharacterized protein LOC132055940 [Lycium ferocissimum]|uniref:uncharacterized protein LOC132055940 n=1 Tax=Lycium ferocissimum TaxID=112874 RepID=UPI0028149FC5|nr:uncharacterized protein LOC132055940 [Lycium ferocissimum]
MTAELTKLLNFFWLQDIRFLTILLTIFIFPITSCKNADSASNAPIPIHRPITRSNSNSWLRNSYYQILIIWSAFFYDSMEHSSSSMNYAVQMANKQQQSTIKINFWTRVLNVQVGETSRLAWLGVEVNPLAHSDDVLKTYSRPTEGLNQPSSKWL